MSQLKALAQAVARNIDHNVGQLSQMARECENILLGQETKVALDVAGRSETGVGKDDGFLYAADECKKIEAKMKARSGPVCKAADLRPKVLPPYQYGYCKEKETVLPMSCPPKIKKRGKGPCCHQEVKKAKGGCKSN